MAEDRVFAPQTQQVAVHLVNRRMALALGEVEFRLLESPLVAGVVQHGPSLRRREAAELREKLRAPVADQRRQLLAVIGEEEERARRGELLPLKEHRDRKSVV